MKKVVLRLVTSVCILAVLAMRFMATWIQIDGISKKEFKELREGVSTNIPNLTIKWFTFGQNYAIIKMFKTTQNHLMNRLCTKACLEL